MKNKIWLWFLARLFIGIIFTYAGFTKLIDPIENFRGVIAEYQVIPYAWVPLIAAVLPWIEFIFGVMMILGYAPKTTAFVLGGLSLSLTIILGASDVLLNQGGADCGCFGEGSLIRLSVRQVFVMDLVNFMLCIGLYRLREHPLSLDSFLKKREN